MDDQPKPNGSDTRNVESERSDSSDSSSGSGNMSGILYLALFAMITGAISYGITFVWPSEDKSLAYLPRFLTSCVLAFFVTSMIGVSPRS